MRAWVYLIFLVGYSWGKVDPPNYQFTLDQLAPFFPHQKLSQLSQKVGPGEKIKQLGAFELWRFYVKQERYVFPVMVQVQGDDIKDFFAQLPSYFLHDVFHQSLINKWGQQKKYFLKHETAFYEWDLSDYKIQYSAACTITCFPIYLHLSTKREKDFKSQLDWLREQSQRE